MGASLPWLALAAAITLINGGTIGYLAWREQSRALRFWACAWIAWAGAAIMLMLIERPPDSSPVFLVCGLLWTGSSLCFLKGTYVLIGRRLPPAWYVVAAACVALALVLALCVTFEEPVAMAPLVSFQCIGMLATGVITLRRMRGQAGALLYGSAMIALALHLLDAPILASDARFFLWGFNLALALEVVTALGMVVLYYDHSRAQLLEAQRTLDNKRRIEALGLVAGGVAHDFNNMLTVMQGHLELMQSNHASGPSASKSLAVMEQSLQQAARLTAQLLTFGKRQEGRAQTLDVGEVVESTLALLENSMPPHIHLRFQSVDRTHLTSGDRALVEQIVLNLVANARDAIASTGQILVEVASTDTPKPEVVLRVTDSGAGMAPEVARRVFEPFFTTKDPGKGTGLGLSSVQEAVDQLGGRIRVESQPGVGTTFEIFLPRVAAGAPSSAGR